MLLFILPPATPRAWDIVWRMAVCGAGFGIFQTPNNIIMVLSSPLERSGGVGGMKGTARLTGQTLAAALTTLVFAIIASLYSSARICLALAVLFAIFAAVFSISQKIPAHAKKFK